MKRKALLIGNSRGLTGVKTDLKKMKSFLYSNHGGAWNYDEIITINNATKTQLGDTIDFIKKDNTDFCIVYFSGHGGFKRQTLIELSDESLINEDFLYHISPRQITIFDCCRSTIQESAYDSAKLSAESINFNEKDRNYYRQLYENRIMQSIYQQIKLYSCSIGEISNDTRNGGVYTQALLQSVQTYQTVGEIHRNAAKIVDTTWNDEHRPEEQQHPDAILPKCLTSQQLVLSISV